MKIKINLKSRLQKFIFVSIAFHLILFLTLNLVNLLNLKKSLKNVEVVLIDSSQITEPKPEANPNQIVETDSQFANNQLDEKAKYHSEKSNTVEKETRAKTGDQFKNSLRQGAKTLQAQKAQQKAKSMALLNPTFDPYEAMVKKNTNSESKEFTQGLTGAQTGETSTTNDRLDAKEDLITKLNTKEYKYYGYYHRIKLQLNQWWQPKIREKVTKMMTQGRTIAADENKTTRLIIILNNAGTLVKVQVLAESGVRDLDDAAVEAFRSAAPFPNPPKGIIENDGTVKIRWDFVVES